MIAPPTHPMLTRRWFQFRLRTLLIVTAIVAAALGWWSYKAGQQREAVAKIVSLGGRVEYDFQVSGNDRPSCCPAWLVNALGVDYFATVEGVNLAYSQVADGDLKQIESLTALRSLRLTGTRVTDAGLDHLTRLVSLQALGLEETKVTDAGLARLKGFSAMRSLMLDDTLVTDSGLEYLKGLTGLEYLYLRTTQVTDAGVARLQKSLPNCEIVN